MEDIFRRTNEESETLSYTSSATWSYSIYYDIEVHNFLKYSTNLRLLIEGASVFTMRLLKYAVFSAFPNSVNFKIRLRLALVFDGSNSFIIGSISTFFQNCLCHCCVWIVPMFNKNSFFTVKCLGKIHSNITSISF